MFPFAFEALEGRFEVVQAVEFLALVPDDFGAGRGRRDGGGVGRLVRDGSILAVAHRRDDRRRTLHDGLGDRLGVERVEVAVAPAAPPDDDVHFAVEGPDAGGEFFRDTLALHARVPEKYVHVGVAPLPEDTPDRGVPVGECEVDRRIALVFVYHLPETGHVLERFAVEGRRDALVELNKRRVSGRNEKPLRGSRVADSGLGRAVWPRSQTRNTVIAGAETRGRPVRPARTPRANVEASSREGSGPRCGACRGVGPGLTVETPSGAEASSGTTDTCRPRGRGVEEASGTTRAGTTGQARASISHSYTGGRNG